jgi:hypothetical protein
LKGRGTLLSRRKRKGKGNKVQAPEVPKRKIVRGYSFHLPIYENRANKEGKMDKVHEEMFKVWRSSWENYVKTLSMMQEQGEKMLDLFFTQSGTLQEEAKKLIKEGMANLKEAQKSYFQVVEENLKKIEELFAQK